MKKILCIIGLILLVSGCSKNEVKLDFNTLETNLNNLTFESKKMFGNNNMVDVNYLSDKYGFDSSNIDESLISMSKVADSASMYAIFLPKKGEKDKAMEAIDKFLMKYDQSWMMGYAPDQEVLVQNRMEEEYGNYLIYIISNDNDKVLETIKSNK
ncbi:MAG: DUF4358 domain-containing protein [Ignavibacteriales bacterium]